LSFPFRPEGGLGLTLGSVFACNLFKRWSIRLHSIHSVTPTVSRQSCSVSHWVCFSLKGPGWTVCHRSSTSALVLNLCDINHYQLKGSCFSVPACHHMEVFNHGLAKAILCSLNLHFIMNNVSRKPSQSEEFNIFIWFDLLKNPKF